MGSHSTKGHLSLGLIFNNRNFLRFRKNSSQEVAARNCAHRGNNIIRGMMAQNRTKNQFVYKIKTILLLNKLCKAISLLL